jgi:tetratricopeptide (TPR) repeat protein
MWQEAAREFREVGDTGGLAATLNNRGDIFLLQGNLDKAQGLLEEAIPGYLAMGDKSGVALVNNDLGDLSRWKGDLAAAETYYQKAKAGAQEMDDKDSLAYVFTGIGDLLTDRGDLPAARKSYDESLALRNHAGEKRSAAQTQVAMARLSIEEGHADQAETAARECRRQFHDEQQADDELESGVVLTRSLLAQNKKEDAQKEIETDQPLAAKSQSYLNRLEFAVVSAQALSASDQRLARGKFEAVLKDAHAHHFGGVELEIQLLLAQLEEKAGHTAAARDQLNSLERTARATGFGLIARKAAAHQ